MAETEFNDADGARVALITGAGSGIGLATAELLASEGWRVGLVGRTQSRLEAAARRIVSLTDAAKRILTIAADVADPDSPRSILERTLDRFGRIDALINNAAVCMVRAIDSPDETLLHETFAANILGPIRLVAAAWPIFTRQKSGRVINVSSLAAADPFPGLSVYAASKGALESFTRAIAVEGQPHNIRAFAVAPGAVETPMLRSVVSIEQLSPDRVLPPQRIAQVIARCARGDCDAESGCVIAVPNP